MRFAKHRIAYIFDKRLSLTNIKILTLERNKTMFSMIIGIAVGAIGALAFTGARSIDRCNEDALEKAKEELFACVKSEESVEKKGANKEAKQTVSDKLDDVSSDDKVVSKQDESNKSSKKQEPSLTPKPKKASQKEKQEPKNRIVFPEKALNDMKALRKKKLTLVEITEIINEKYALHVSPSTVKRRINELS